jgi:predicted nucleotidyltransferase
MPPAPIAAVHPDPSATAAFLIARAERELAERALAAKKARSAVEAAVVGFRRETGPFRAWLIGSLAWGEFAEGSDVDLVVDGLPAEHLWRLETRVAKASGRSVDLLALADLLPDFAERVRSEGVPL